MHRNYRHNKKNIQLHLSFFCLSFIWATLPEINWLLDWLILDMGTVCSFPFSALIQLFEWQKGYLGSAKSCVLVCWCWQYDWRFSCLTDPAVSITSIFLSSNKIQNEDILVPADAGLPGSFKWLLTERERGNGGRHTVIETLKIDASFKAVSTPATLFTGRRSLLTTIATRHQHLSDTEHVTERGCFHSTLPCNSIWARQRADASPKLNDWRSLSNLGRPRLLLHCFGMPTVLASNAH